MSEKDGGPAFACVTDTYLQEGMSLRDYFAGQALASLARIHSGDLPDAIAKKSYAMADAMLAESNKP